MWVLALGGVFLAVGQACIFCRLPAHDLPGRLARITSGIDARWKDWAVPDFSAFALDELTMNKVTEKTHRVLRVIEIKGSLSSLLPYWQWLQKTKIPQYTREGLCAPACRSHDLWKARIVLSSIVGAALLLGGLSLQVEALYLRAKDDL
ncbi:sperm-egg fusion protein TMEM95 isoform X4 [Dipodomys merriami]|uniref:sperm-egg fusion protein TMEM95 isoform X4 n=1 Tax=Dipodomys merriami TaxID=94247 RepID=UPI003855D34E